MNTHLPRQLMPHYPSNVYLPTQAMIATNTIINNLINTLSLYSFRFSGLCADLGQATPRKNDLHHLFCIVPARYSPGKLTGTPFGGSPFGPVPLRNQRKLHFSTFWTRANFVSDESQARTIICHRQEIAFAVGEYHCAVRGITI